jgi:hypothetical protein
MNPSSSASVEKRGAALVIVLAFLVILTGLVVAYLARTSTDRQLAHGTFNENRADIMARSALDVVIADLKQEIAAGSTASTVSGYTVYTPTGSANMLPVRSGNPSGSPDPIPNLVRRSLRSDPILAPGIKSRASAVNSTTDVSQNGRSISTTRWNKHYFVPKGNAATDDSSPIPSFTPPDWVLVTRNGPGPSPTPFNSWNASLADASPGNGNYVIGRYAYAVYDEGGLIDVNVKGYPSPAPSPATYVQSIGRKGDGTFADLSQLGLSATGINNVIGWRNYASAQPTGNLTANFTFGATSATNFVKYILSSTNGFMSTYGTPWPGPSGTGTDQAFVTRQELISFRATISPSPNPAFPANALQYLTTFSRELNRPTWKPYTPTGSTIDYATLAKTPTAETSTAINRDLTAVRDSSGNQLIKTRFPLSRLSWLTYNGPSASRTMPPASPALPATDPNYDMWQLLYTYGVPQSYLQLGTAANIKTSFGLVWDSRAYVASPRAGQQWVYDSPSSAHSGGTFDGTTGTAATVIKTLDTVQSEARAPDFFEVLKAVILNGSLGLGSNNTANTFVMADPKYYNTTNGSADYQIMQIGANIIDEWDTDNIPTFISFNGFEPTGVENLPYLNKLVFSTKFPDSSPATPCQAWLVPSLWNPHQNAASATGTIRVALTGTASITATAINTSNLTATSSPMPLPASMDINVSWFGGFATPWAQTGPTQAPLATAGPLTSTGSPAFFYGFDFRLDLATNASQINKQNVSSGYPNFGTVGGASSVELQIQLPGTSTFIPYLIWKIAASDPLNLLKLYGINQSYFDTNSPMLQDPRFVALDPRTVRFGIWGSAAGGQTQQSNWFKDYVRGMDESLDMGDPAHRMEQITLYRPQGSSFTVGAFPTDLTLYAANTGVGNHYLDLDGVQRHGDWTTDVSGTANKTTIMYAWTSAIPPAAPIPPAGNIQDRPQILNGPFQSVAELGQVFRDQPWKTLAFTITNSGDAGLLDAFTLQDVPMVAGRASLNTRQSVVLKAILSQATMNLVGTSIITTAQRDAIVTAIIGHTATTPMINKGELVTWLAGDASVTALTNKEARECVVRAFSDACQTRTWNLMIDVVAQSGRYPPNAGSGPNTANPLANFLVEGEKRYWLHVAIDRFTGEIVDQQLEAVYE